MPGRDPPPPAYCVPPALVLRYLLHHKGACLAGLRWGRKPMHDEAFVPSAAHQARW